MRREASLVAWFALALAGCAQGSEDTSYGPIGADSGAPVIGSVEAGGGSSDATTGAPGQGNGSGPSSGEDSAAPPSGGGDSGGNGDDTGAGPPAGDDSGTPPSDDSGPPSGTDAGSVVPTTCTQADNAYGCCVGNALYYCKGSSSITKETCSGGKVCGWDSSSSYYDCVSTPGSDPSGKHSIDCE